MTNLTIIGECWRALAGYMCQSGDGGGDKGGCGASAVSIVSQAMAVNLPSPIDFHSIHSFRDDFLSKSDVGKSYISYLYVFSQFLRINIDTLPKYISIIYPLQSSIRTVMDDHQNGIVVTDELNQKAKEIINLHKNVDDEDFQRILSQMEKDLDRLVGLSKTDFIRNFEGEVIKVN